MLVKVLQFFILPIPLWTKQWWQTPEEPGSTGKLVVNIVKHTHTDYTQCQIELEEMCVLLFGSWDKLMRLMMWEDGFLNSHIQNCFSPPFCFKIMHQLGPSFFLHSKRLHYHAPYHGHRGSKPHFYIPFSCRVRILIKLLPLSWVLQAWLHLILLFSDFMPWVNPCATLRLCGVDPSLWTYVNLLVGI